jgi:hypothetical protein
MTSVLPGARGGGIHLLDGGWLLPVTMRDGKHEDVK